MSAKAGTVAIIITTLTPNILTVASITANTACPASKTTSARYTSA